MICRGSVFEILRPLDAKLTETKKKKERKELLQLDFFFKSERIAQGKLQLILKLIRALGTEIFATQTTDGRRTNFDFMSPADIVGF